MAQAIQPYLGTRRWRREEVEMLRPPSVVTPLAAPGARIPVADLLP